VYAEEEARLLAEAASGADLEVLVARRVAGEPLEHVLGRVEFAGLRLAVAPGVFVPRARTELLAREAVRLIGDRADPVLVELCCGVGAVAAAAVAALPGLEVHASDIDPAAVACARRNLPEAASVTVSDLDSSLPESLRGRVDVLVANAPYVPTDGIATMPREARDHEPVTALDGGPDGLDVARRVVALARGWLRPGGHLVIETGAGQAAALAEAFIRAGLAAETTSWEERDSTAVVGTAP
jgi:release factor glutamine methyltransferase